MATNYLQDLNKEIDTNTAKISNAESRDALFTMSSLVAKDIVNIKNYINSIVVKSFETVCSKPRFEYDASEEGVSGITLITYPEPYNDHHNKMYWMDGATPEEGRPRTIKETFDYFFTVVTQQIIEQIPAFESLDDIKDSILCLGRNLERLKIDTYGKNYSFNCNSSETKTYSLSQHLYQIFLQTIDGLPDNILNQLDIDSPEGYPQLSLKFDIPSLQQVTEVGNTTTETITVGGLNVNNEFSLPTVEGSPGQVLTADGDGNTSWQDSNFALAEEEVVGAVYIADINEVKSGEKTAPAGSEQAEGAVTPQNLHAGIESTSSLRDKIKDAALEQDQENNLDVHNDVSYTSGPAEGDFLVYQGGNWIPQSITPKTEYITYSVQSSFPFTKLYTFQESKNEVFEINTNQNPTFASFIQNIDPKTDSIGMGQFTNTTGKDLKLIGATGSLILELKIMLSLGDENGIFIKDVIQATQDNDISITEDNTGGGQDTAEFPVPTKNEPKLDIKLVVAEENISYLGTISKQDLHMKSVAFQLTSQPEMPEINDEGGLNDFSFQSESDIIEFLRGILEGQFGDLNSSTTTYKHKIKLKYDTNREGLFLNGDGSDIHGEGIVRNGETLTIMPFCNLPNQDDWFTKPGDQTSPIAVNWLRFVAQHFEMSFHFEVL